MFKISVVLWGISVSDFWKMSPHEWWLIYDAKHGSKNNSNLSDEDIQELQEMIEDAE